MNSRSCAPDSNQVGAMNLFATFGIARAEEVDSCSSELLRIRHAAIQGHGMRGVEEPSSNGTGHGRHKLQKTAD